VDITSSKRSEEALRESQEVLSLAMQSSRMGAWSRDLSNETVYWSAELEEIFGLEPGAFSGNLNGFYSYVYVEDKESLAREVWNAINEHRSYIIEFRFHHADGSLRWMEGRGQAVYAENGTPTKVYGIGIDITERKQAEAERERLLISEQQARETAEEANKAKDEFIALVSHELRSPLNAMLGWTRILQHQNPDEKTREYALDVIVRNARSQSRLIEDLLDIARVSRGKLRLEMEPTELIPIINAAVEIIKPTAEANNIKLGLTLDRAADFITGDADRLRQVIENLLSNAVKFTPAGGSVEIRLNGKTMTLKLWSATRDRESARSFCRRFLNDSNKPTRQPHAATEVSALVCR
jgi:PAS domain S-box-containing protein